MESNWEATFSTRSVRQVHDVTIELLLEVEFSVEARSNISTAALLVVGGDEKGTQCLGYNRAILFLGDINIGTWPSRLGSLESERVKCDHENDCAGEDQQQL
jgi:hypothetical protein